MKIVTSSNGNKVLRISRQEWENIGKQFGWIVEAKKKSKKNKEWNPNPWAVCTKSVGREDAEKYERCVMDVKSKQSKD